jgi:hypothetical protein
MTKPTMTSQWDPGSYKPLDMSKIPGYPRQMPPISKRWFPKFTGGNGEDAEFHMREFYSYFVLNRVDDDAEDVVMKLFQRLFMEMLRSGMITFLMLASLLWTSLKKSFLKNGAFIQKTSQYF